MTEEGKRVIVRRTDSPRRGIMPREEMTVREILQWYGTEYRRAQDPEYWVRNVEGIISLFKAKIRPPSYAIIDDARMPNELAPCDIKIRIEPYPGYASSDEHASETALDDYEGWDFIGFPALGGLPDLAEDIIRRLKLQ